MKIIFTTLLLLAISPFHLFASNQLDLTSSEQGKSLPTSLEIRDQENPDLYLRSMVSSDSFALTPFFTDPASMKYFRSGKTYKENEVQNVVASFIDSSTPNDLRNHAFSIIYQGEVIGQVSTFPPEDPNGPFEIGYGLIQTMAGKGITTRACKLLLDHIHEDCFATVHPENGASINVLEKLGFTPHPDPKQKGVKKTFNGVEVLRDYYIKIKLSSASSGV